MSKAASGCPGRPFLTSKLTREEPLGAHLHRIARKDGETAVLDREEVGNFRPRQIARSWGHVFAQGAPRPTRLIRARAERQLCAMGEHDLFLRTVVRIGRAG